MDHENEVVTSVFGKMSRRELLGRLAVSGLAIGLGGSEILTALGSTSFSDGAPPPKPLGGTPFREITRYQSLMDDKFDLKGLQRFGIPRPRTRDTSWLDKPSNAVGVSLLQFTNPPSISLNSCSQAACATVLNFYKIAPTGIAGDAVTEKIYAEHPPDGGERGTSFPYTVKTLESYGLKTWTGRSNELGEQTMIEKLKSYVSQGRPSVVMVDLRKPQGVEDTSTRGHFVVVYAYTETHVFMTNWNYPNTKKRGWRNDWETFKLAWSMPDMRNHHLMAVAWA